MVSKVASWRFWEAQVLYIAHNLVKEWAEFIRLQELPVQEDLLFVGNPLYEGMEESVWKAEASKRLPNLRKLDGDLVIHEKTNDKEAYTIILYSIEVVVIAVQCTATF